MFCSTCGTQCPIVSHFCHSCGKNLQDERASLSSENDTEVNEDSIITEYFHSGYPYNTIVDLLKKRGIVMHLWTLKRKLKDLGLSRRGNYVDEDMVRNVIAEEIIDAGRLSGYRSIWHALRLRHQIHAPRGLVARLVRELDPDGVEERRARRLSRRRYSSLGPNFCWHIDGKVLIVTFRAS
jgi:hypothetical protein